MTISPDYFKERLAEMESDGEINPHIHAFLLTRLDSMLAVISDYDSVEDVVTGELYSFDLEPGYQHYGDVMVALTQEEALTVFDEGSATIFAVCANGTEFELEYRDQIERGYHCYAIEKGHTLTFQPEMEMSL